MSESKIVDGGYLHINAARYLMDVEWDAWRNLCKRLQATGVVTQQDCETPQNAVPVTPGQRVFVAISEWGESLAALRRAQE